VDEEELIAHLAALKRNGLVDGSHDRRIPAGGILHDEIDGRTVSVFAEAPRQTA
jgi:hypothetical protein